MADIFLYQVPFFASSNDIRLLDPTVVPPAPPSPSSQKDGDPDYWKLPWFKDEGESFSDRLRAKTDAAPEEEAVLPVKKKRRAAKVKAEPAGLLLTDSGVEALGDLAEQMRSRAVQRVAERADAQDSGELLAAMELQRDEEEALVALGMY